MPDLWDRHLSVTCGNVEITYPEFAIEARMMFDWSTEPDTADITIHNLRGETAREFQEDKELILNAGHGDDVGTIMVGKVAHMSEMWDGPNRVTEVEVSDITEDFLARRISRTWPPGAVAERVLKDILDESGLEVGHIKIPQYVWYKDGRTVDGPLQRVAKEIAEEGGARLHVVHGAVFVTPQEDASKMGPYLDEETGLLERPTMVEDEDADWDIKCLLNHRIRSGARVAVSSAAFGEGVVAVMRVVDGTHNMGEGDFTTEFRASLDLTPPPKAEEGGAPERHEIPDLSGRANCGQPLTWTRGGGGPVPRLIPRKSYFNAQDWATGKRMRLYRYGGTNHLDAEPASRSDTGVLRSLQGWSWNHRPMLVFAGGKTIAASFHTYPHGGQDLTNGFNGHFCIHFRGSMTHTPDTGPRTHQQAQANIRRASC